MAKVTLNKVPAAAEAAPDHPVRQAAAEVTVTDARGRVLSLREPNVLAPYRLVKIVGGEAAANRVYMQMVFPLLYLASLDGDLQVGFNTEREMEALLMRLGNEGVAALREGIEKYFAPQGKAEEDAEIKK